MPLARRLVDHAVEGRRTPPPTSGSKVTCTASADLAIDITSPLETPWPATSPTATARRPSSSARHVVEVAAHLGRRQVGVGQVDSLQARRQLGQDRALDAARGLELDALALALGDAPHVRRDVVVAVDELAVAAERAQRQRGAAGSRRAAAGSPGTAATGPARRRAAPTPRVAPHATATRSAWSAGRSAGRGRRGSRRSGSRTPASSRRACTLTGGSPRAAPPTSSGAQADPQRRPAPPAGAGDQEQPAEELAVERGCRAKRQSRERRPDGARPPRAEVEAGEGADADPRQRGGERRRPRPRASARRRCRAAPPAPPWRCRSGRWPARRTPPACAPSARGTATRRPTSSGTRSGPPGRK